jgi:hypothetical protein
MFKRPAVRRFPAVVSLAYWLRPGPVAAQQQAFMALGTDGVLLVPRGLVFHVPPANVDTMFVYSWVMSLLVGNRNIVRVPERRGEVIDILLAAIGDTLREPGYVDLAQRNWFVRTGHDDEVSRALSAAADMRVVWGGDATVRHFQQFRLPIHGKELSFPNRHSFSILDAESVATADDGVLRAAADAFFNDAYWFDQTGCSSPRLIIWYAPHGMLVDDARRRFHRAVGEIIDARQYRTETGIAITKRTAAYGAAIALSARQVEIDSSEATWVRLDALSHYDRSQHPGGGLFFEVVSQDLQRDLAEFLRPVDQTVTTWGLPLHQLRELARRLTGRGVDRWVPLGQALQFDRIWDGMDLLQEFSKRVVIGARTVHA